MLNLLFKKDSSSVEIPFFELVSFVDGKGYAAHDNIQHVEVFDEDGTAISCKAQAHGMIELDNAATAQYRVYYTTIQNKEKYNVEAHYMPYLHLTIKGKGNENNNTGDVVIDLSKCALSYNNSWNFRGNQLNSATVAFNVIGDSWISFM